MLPRIVETLFPPPPVTEQVIREQTGGAIMRSVGRVRASAKPQFSLVQSTNASNSPSNSTQRGGSELEKEGRWFRLEALNMSDLILSRRTRLSLPPPLSSSLTRFTLQYVQTFRAQLRHGI